MSRRRHERRRHELSNDEARDAADPDSMSPSATICRINWPRRAGAARTAIRARATWARTSRRLATFRQASRSTSAATARPNSWTSGMTSDTARHWHGARQGLGHDARTDAGVRLLGCSSASASSRCSSRCRLRRPTRPASGVRTPRRPGLSGCVQPRVHTGIDRAEIFDIHVAVELDGGEGAAKRLRHDAGDAPPGDHRYGRRSRSRPRSPRKCFIQNA